jgi:hypothetical protein
MKKMLLITIAAMLLFSTIILTTTAGASDDRILSAKIVKVTKRISKKGNAYVRLTIEEPRTLQGVTYNAEMPVMAFGSDRTKRALKMKPGDTLNAVVEISKYKGNTSYIIRAFLETTQKKRSK